MKKIINIAWLNIIQLLRNKGELLGIILLPVALTLIFSLVFGGNSFESKVSVVFVDKDETKYSEHVFELLKAEESFEVKKTTSGEADELLTNGEVAVSVVVPNGFGSSVKEGKKTDIEVFKNPDSTKAIGVVEVVSGIGERIAANAKTAHIAQEAIDDVREEFEAKPLTLFTEGVSSGFPPMLIKDLPAEIRSRIAEMFPYFEVTPAFDSLFWTADEEWEPEPPVSVKVEKVIPSEVRGESVTAEGFSQFSLGFTVMFIMFVVLNSAGGILDEREIGTLSRLLTTPTPRTWLLAGKIVTIFLTGALEAIILIGLGATVFKVQWGRDPLSLIVIIGAYLLASTGLAIFLSSLVRTRGQLSAIGPVVAVALAMLGGCYWPIEIVTPFMHRLADFTPTGWAMYGLVDVVARNQGISEAVVPSLVLLGFAVLFFGLGVKFLKFE